MSPVKWTDNFYLTSKTSWSNPWTEWGILGGSGSEKKTKEENFCPQHEDICFCPFWILMWGSSCSLWPLMTANVCSQSVIRDRLPNWLNSRKPMIQTLGGTVVCLSGSENRILELGFIKFWWWDVPPVPLAGERRWARAQGAAGHVRPERRRRTSRVSGSPGTRWIAGKLSLKRGCWSAQMDSITSAGHLQSLRPAHVLPCRPASLTQLQEKKTPSACLVRFRDRLYHCDIIPFPRINQCFKLRNKCDAHYFWFRKIQTCLSWRTEIWGAFIRSCSRSDLRVWFSWQSLIWRCFSRNDLPAGAAGWPVPHISEGASFLWRLFSPLLWKIF